MTRPLAPLAALAAALALAAPAAAQGTIDFKTVPGLDCKLAQVHMCGGEPKCEGGPGQHIFRFDLDKDMVCVMAGPGQPCEKPEKMEAFEGGMLPGILIVARGNRSMFHIAPDGAMTGTQLGAGGAFTMIGTCAPTKK